MVSYGGLMATKRTKNDAPTKDRILEAAVKEFADVGFHGARIDEIARISGANKAMIYYHFKSKEGLYDALATEVFGTILSLIKKELDEDLPENERVYALTRTISEFISSLDDDFRRIVLWEIASGGKVLKSSFAPRFAKPALAMIIKMYSDGQKKGTIRDINALYTHLTIIGSIVFMNILRMMLKGSILEKLVVPKDFAEKFTENLIDILRHSIEPEMSESGTK
jgi:TetR/AcrR family transcriptional regulator